MVSGIVFAKLSWSKDTVSKSIYYELVSIPELQNWMLHIVVQFAMLKVDAKLYQKKTRFNLWLKMAGGSIINALFWTYLMTKPILEYDIVSNIRGLHKSI